MNRVMGDSLCVTGPTAVAPCGLSVRHLETPTTSLRPRRPSLTLIGAPWIIFRLHEERTQSGRGGISQASAREGAWGRGETLLLRWLLLLLLLPALTGRTDWRGRGLATEARGVGREGNCQRIWV